MTEDAIFIRGLEFDGNHGFYPEERKSTRRFRVNLEASFDLKKAASSDALEDTLDYFRLCQIIHDVGTQRTFRLLEALAGAIADEVLLCYPKLRLVIEIEKLGPSCPGVPECCAVRLVFPSSQAPVLA